jgi:hypothetical protein
MAKHYLEIIGISFLLIFAITIVYQGRCISKGKCGYSLRDYMKQDSMNMRKRIEELLKEK